MFCKRCGKEIPNDSNVCQYCGSQVTPRTSANTYTNFNNTTVNQAPPVPQKKKKKTPWKIIAPIVAVLLIIAIIFGVFACSNSKKKAAEEKLRQILAESTTKPVVEFMCEDYDGDGTYEAYAVVGDSEEKEEYVEYSDADICFVNEEEAEVIKESVRGHANGTIEVGNTIYVSLEVYDDGAETGKSFIYTAEDSESVESDISGKYSDVREEDGKVIGKDENGNEIEVELTDKNEDDKSDNGSDTDSRAEVNPNIIEDVRNAKVGDIVEFGSYPQSEVKDPALLEKLNAQELNWISYGYYSGTGDYNDGKMKSGDWMKYADIIFEGKKYRAVTFSEYRPERTNDINSTENSEQDENGYTINNVYFFKYESLKWRVLNPLDGFLMCENLIDCQAFNNTVYFDEGLDDFYQDVSCKAYANNYKVSSIRSWLNGSFYDIAFIADEYVKIKSTNLDNSCWTSDSHKYDGENTDDKIFLLSYSTITNESYGFLGTYGSDPYRSSICTDYAECQGLRVHFEFKDYNGDSNWLLRSSGDVSGSEGSCIGVEGTLSPMDPAIGVNCNTGIRPALKLNME